MASLEYWERQSHDEKGMMGGNQDLSPADEGNSRFVLEEILGCKPDEGRSAAELGAGIGRVTERVLVRFFEQIDVFEPIAGNREVAQKSLAKHGARVRVFPHSLQNWQPQRHQYNVIWIQYCIIYASDAECVQLFKKAKACLSTDGYLVIKDNIKQGWQLKDFPVDFGESDGSYIRSEPHLIHLAEQSGFTYVKSVIQDRWPSHLYKVLSLIFRVETKEDAFTVASETSE